MKYFFLGLILLVCNTVLSQRTVTNIKFEGLRKTKVSFLSKIVATKIEQPLDTVLLKKDIIRLKRLPGIAHAAYQVIDTAENLYSIIFNLEENFTIIPDFNIWTTTNKRVAYKIGVQEHNFLGKNIAIGGFYQNNTFNSYGINFRAPNLFSKHFGLAINFQDWKSEEPLYFNDGTANYLYHNKSYEVLGLYEINFNNSLQFGVNYFNEKYNYISGITNSSIPLKLDTDKILAKVIYTYDELDYFYQYIHGFKNILHLQYVTSNRNDDFLIAWNDLFYYKRIGKRGNWANRLRMGLASNTKSPFAPFALDNNVNLRGVGILVDRGTGSMVWNTEYRHTLFDNNWFVIQGNLFTDMGSWRNPGGKLSDFTNHKNIKVYSGFGLRFINKKIFNAVFRIDYGHGLMKNSSKGLVFGIGQYF